MDSLANYGSDGENSNNSNDSKYPETGDISSRRASDANYDPVQMDMSEVQESNNNNSSPESGSERTNSPASGRIPTSSSRTESSRTYSSPADQRRTDNENHSSTSSRDDHRRSDRAKYSTDKSRRSSNEERRQRDPDHRDSKDTRKPRDEERKSRDDERRRSDRTSSGSCREDKTEDRDKTDKDHHHREDRRDRDRDRNERDRRRDRDRDRRYVRDDRTKDRHRDERSSYHKEKDRTRSRSRSRDRAPLPFRTMSYREEKGRNKLAQLEKLGIELKAPEGDPVTPNVQGEPNYYNPLATATQGKYAEQIQKRKLLWANKSKSDEGKKTTTAASTANTWVGTTFTHDQDGKVTAKFKRLMGIKGDLPTAPPAGAKPDILKKQEEMFNNMEQQYEVARATTHTQRGVGLGYATGGYQFPR
ncbi:arginine/serine-rich coiled-coil protein 2 isoform X3 [Cephus cinctus]|uniref:Arginine/serine-rich coiled-coil protein 2 isoform X3 n=1 Tax=Cephus cinctus TaxID=211228 RepID=A0AAJ7RGA5_CEPCN|nr:arginine/serine-rich coiled-coil protein 2 isoform X3 [Cephus cinctus]